MTRTGLCFLGRTISERFCQNPVPGQNRHGGRPTAGMMVINSLSPLPRVSTPGILRRLSLSIAMMLVICVGIGCVCAPTQDDQTGSGANTATAVSPTATAVSPTATVVPPTATVVPPTATVVPPTATAERDSLTAAGLPDSLGSSGVSQVTVREFFLELDFPESLEAVLTDSSLKIEGRTRIDAFVTVNDHVVEPDIEGRFSQVLELAPGLNIIEVIASTASGEQKSLVLGIGYKAQ
jgi:hypothetical protein